MPRGDWLRFFIKIHRLAKRFPDNIKASRVEVNHEIMNNYFDNLQKWLEGIAPDNIFNYDETNATDDHDSKTVIVLGGRKRVEKKTHHSKSSTSVMFCRNASKNFLPPMVEYKSGNVYNIGQEMHQMEQFVLQPKMDGSITEHLLHSFSKLF